MTDWFARHWFGDWPVVCCWQQGQARLWLANSVPDVVSRSGQVTPDVVSRSGQVTPDDVSRSGQVTPNRVVQGCPCALTLAPSQPPAELVGFGPLEDLAPLLAEQAVTQPGAQVQVPVGTGRHPTIAGLLERGVLVEAWRPWTWMWCGPELPGGAALAKVPSVPNTTISIVPENDPDGSVRATLEAAYPQASAWPGDPSLDAWMVLKDQTGQALGVIGLERGDHGRAPFLASLAVLPQARRRGIGAYLVTQASKMALDLAKQAGKEPLIGLGVYSDQTASIGLYQRLGYVREADLESYRVAMSVPLGTIKA